LSYQLINIVQPQLC